MLSTRLTTIDQGILSNTSIPAILRPLIERRTNNKRIFGKLEIIAPQFEDVAPATKTATADATDATATTAPRRIIAGFLLDNSGSMQGRKIQHAINTIKQLAEILLSERDQGKTIASQPIHSWIYVITFNSDAELVIPFQEITADTLPNILTQLDQIRTTGCTNYERAFKKQTEVIRGIYCPPTGGSYHLIRFFGTDGEITEGTRRTEILYKMMRDTDAAYLNDTATATAATAATASTDAVGGLAPPTGLSIEDPPLGGGTPLTFEDYILGYGTDVDLNCLKTLASPYQRSEYMADRTHTTTDAYNCSSLITIVKPEDIGWQMGELLFKVIMRYGYKVQVSISATADATADATATDTDTDATPQIFEYQSHTWSNSTTLHSIIHGETKPLYIQYTPPTNTDTDGAAASTAVLVKVQYSNQFTGSTYTYDFEHTIIPSPTTATDASAPDLPISPRTPPGLSNVVPPLGGGTPPDLPIPHQSNVVPPLGGGTPRVPPLGGGTPPDLPTAVGGMIQIEIFKQFREIEASGAATGGSKYDKDTIVREAYKTIRMLKSLQRIESTPLIENLITDVKVIIGLTTIQDKKETEMVLHARRICSAEQEVFNTGANISRKYVDGEEEHEEEAARVIKSFHDAADAADATAATPDDENDNDEELVFDAIHSRITTVIDTPYSQSGYGRGQSSRHHHHHHHHRHHDGSSELRTLCARIAMAKKDKEDFTTEQLYEQVRRYGLRAGYHQHHDAAANDDQFSSTPMDDEYTQRRMGMMRQMSSQSPSQSSL